MSAFKSIAEEDARDARVAAHHTKESLAADLAESSKSKVQSSREVIRDVYLVEKADGSLVDSKGGWPVVFTQHVTAVWFIERMGLKECKVVPGEEIMRRKS